ncbi:MAG: arsenate reductase [Marivirga sp.]|jgi:arsenate reductase
MKFYHNPRCGKSRKALQLLQERNAEIQVIEYLKEIPTKVDIKVILKKLGLDALQLVRKNETIYKEQYKGKELGEDEWIDAMIKHPKLIERPILVHNDNAVIGRPPENVLTLL